MAINRLEKLNLAGTDERKNAYQNAKNRDIRHGAALLTIPMA